MKKSISLLACTIMLFSVSVSAQKWKKLKNKASEVKQANLPVNGLSQEEVAKGLKEALNQGVSKGVTQLNKKGGYLKDPQIKIPLPSEAQKVEKKMRGIGQGTLVDKTIETINRAAEDAAAESKDIFVVAIKEMTLTDAMGILKGDKNAATKYLESATYQELTAKFQPVIKASLDKVGATKSWSTLFGTYNKIPLTKKVNPDLVSYVTDKALYGLFVQVAKEELKIRQDPKARATDLLKKVFGN